MIAWQFTFPGEIRSSHTYTSRFWGEKKERFIIIIIINKNLLFRKMNLPITKKSFYMECDSLKCSHI